MGKVFANHIFERGYDYYCENAVGNIDISVDSITADVAGTKVYEVEIYLENGKVTDMYCSCPYASDGKHCKYMAAVLYEWSEREDEQEGTVVANEDLILQAYNTETFKKKLAAVEELVEGSSEEDVRSFLATVLSEDERLLL